MHPRACGGLVGGGLVGGGPCATAATSTTPPPLRLRPVRSLPSLAGVTKRERPSGLARARRAVWSQHDLQLLADTRVCCVTVAGVQAEAERRAGEGGTGERPPKQGAAVGAGGKPGDSPTAIQVAAAGSGEDLHQPQEQRRKCDAAQVTAQLAVTLSLLCSE